MCIRDRLGIVESEEAFYETLYKKWREYLHRLTSGQKLIKALGRDFTAPEDCLLYTSGQGQKIQEAVGKYPVAPPVVEDP